jgi:DNA-binding winged helix-turn-helix (wHTH) protein/TolB-like protein/Tfp pilus assembly protein PilF
MTRSENETYQFGKWRLHVPERVLRKDGEVIALTPRVFDTLLFLVRNAGRVLEKNELMVAIWPDAHVEENNLNQNISTLRRIFGSDPPENGFIVTVPGRGYRFAAPVQASADDAVMTAPVPSRRRLTLALLGGLVAALLGWLTWIATRDTAREEPIRSIAVLPFKPLLPEQQDRALQFGMADTLIGRLRAIGGLSVRSMEEVRRYGAIDQNAVAAGVELNVQAVLDGTIQRDGERLRVTARLVRVADQKQLWEGRFHALRKDIFAVQDSIAEQVAGGLALQLSEQEQNRLVRQTTDDPFAYELYLRGRLFMSLAQPAQAIEVYEQAIRRDPEFSLAHAGLADIYSRLPIAADAEPRPAMTRAENAARRALALDSDLGEAHTSMGWIHFYSSWDWAASEASFRRALRINPGDPSARLGYAHLLSNTGRHDEALRQIDEALKLDPFSPLARTLRAQFLLNAGREQAGAQELDRVLQRHPSFWIALHQRGRIEERGGRYDQAVATYTLARQSTSSREPLALLAHVHAAAGRDAEARRFLEEVEAIAQRAYVPPYFLALAHAGLGDDEEALQWLERGWEARDVRMVFLAVDPHWDDLRRHPRFVALLEKMKLRV